MKEVIGEPKRIDDVLQSVDSLVAPIEELDFDPFNIRKMDNWKNVIQDFQRKVRVRSRICLHLERICWICFRFLHPVMFLLIQGIEREAIYFIDQSFKTLRSASVAFEMLLKFQHIRSREVLNNQMMMKFNDILVQYCKEV